MHIYIIGGGAAGCFAAIEAARLMPQASITILERGSKLLAKVAVTGGGRCNLTNSFNAVKSLKQVYPRGFRLMTRLMHQFSHTDTYQWFEHHGVQLVTQDDECVFPQSQDAMEIVRTLTSLLHKHKVRVLLNSEVTSIAHDTTYSIITRDGATHQADRLIVATGGQPTGRGLQMFESLQLKMEQPVPSLFSFKIEDSNLTSLMGTVVKQTAATIPGQKFEASGPTLITHWGLSGPAILKLSSQAARWTAERSYRDFSVSVNWLSDMSLTEVDDMLRVYISEHRNKQVTSVHPSQLNARLWQHLLSRASIDTTTKWCDLSKKNINRLTNCLTNDTYPVSGKNRFKDEFVTCGGISLSNLNSDTLECKSHPGLYFAGELTDIDGITGGFNLQAAWTMGFVCAHGIARSQESE